MLTVLKVLVLRVLKVLVLRVLRVLGVLTVLKVLVLRALKVLVLRVLKVLESPIESPRGDGVCASRRRGAAAGEHDSRV